MFIEGTGNVTPFKQDQGPIFTIEPMEEVIFLNTEGTTVQCTSFGRPAPEIEWVYVDKENTNSPVKSLPDILTVLANNSLYFHPFQQEQYKERVHNAKIRCQASNTVGTIISRNVTIKAGIYWQLHVIICCILFVT